MNPTSLDEARPRGRSADRSRDVGGSVTLPRFLVWLGLALTVGINLGCLAVAPTLWPINALGVIASAMAGFLYWRAG